MSKITPKSALGSLFWRLEGTWRVDLGFQKWVEQVEGSKGDKKYSKTANNRGGVQGRLGGSKNLVVSLRKLEILIEFISFLIGKQINYFKIFSFL